MNLFGELNQKDRDEINKVFQDENLDVSSIRSYISSIKHAYYYNIREISEGIARFLIIIGLCVCLFNIYLSNSLLEGLIISGGLGISISIIYLGEQFFNAERITLTGVLLLVFALIAVIYYNPFLALGFVTIITVIVNGAIYLKRFAVVHIPELEYFIKEKIKNNPGKYLTHNDELVRKCSRNLINDQK